MQHVHLDVLGFGMFEGLAAGFVGDLLGEDDHGVRIADAGLEVGGVVQNALEGDAALLRGLDVILLQAVDSADQCDAHGKPLWYACFRLGMTAKGLT